MVGFYLIFMSEAERNTRLTNIADYLIVNASFLNDIGLYHGKMGISLFFAYCASYFQNDIYNDFAKVLLMEVSDEISEDMNMSFENGISGIAWGILCLWEKGLISGNLNDLLKDIDCRMMEIDLLRLSNYSLQKVGKGISCYIKYRLRLVDDDIEKTSFDKLYISEWIEMRKKLTELDDMSLASIVSMNQFKYDLLTSRVWKLGLQDGCAGYGLNLIML